MPYGAALSSSQHLCRILVRGPIVRSMDLPLVAALDITGEKKDASCTQVIQQGKA
jgi:hypothetical protein